MRLTLAVLSCTFALSDAANHKLDVSEGPVNAFNDLWPIELALDPENDPRNAYQTMPHEELVEAFNGVLELTDEPPDNKLKEELDELSKRASIDYIRSWPIPVQEIWKMVPYGPDWYPEPLQGVMWMDQYGYYGHSDIEGAPEQVMTFGEQNFYQWDEKEPNHMYLSGVCGGAWVMEQATTAGKQYAKLACYPRPGYADRVGGISRFTFDDDFKVAYFDGYRNGGFGGSGQYLGIMYRQTPPEGACPPAENATRIERNLCATWIRRSFGANDYNMTGPYWDYPVWQIVDGEGLPREPYFSAFVEGNTQWLNNTHFQMGFNVKANSASFVDVNRK